MFQVTVPIMVVLEYQILSDKGIYLYILLNVYVCLCKGSLKYEDKDRDPSFPVIISVLVLFFTECQLNVF